MLHKEVIEAAYKKLAQKYHPGVNSSSPSAVEKIREINIGHGILCDPLKRKIYHEEWIQRNRAKTNAYANVIGVYL